MAKFSSPSDAGPSIGAVNLAYAYIRIELCQRNQVLQLYVTLAIHEIRIDKRFGVMQVPDYYMYLNNSAWHRFINDALMLTPERTSIRRRYECN